MHHHYKSAYGIGGYIIMTSLLVGAIQVPPTYHRCDLFGLDAPQQRLVSVRRTSQTLGGGRRREGERGEGWREEGGGEGGESYSNRHTQLKFYHQTSNNATI